MVMNLLDKFDAVTVEADFRITPEDKAFCEAHQAAYDAAIQSFHELAFFWEDMENTQKELLGSKEDTYLSSRDGPEISQRRINAHLEWLHRAVISNIVYHFNSTYHVSVRDDYVANNLLPQMPDLRIYENKEAREAYHKKLREAKIRYAEAIQQLLPDRPLIQVTGSTTTFAKRRALRKSLKETGNGILLCTQQSLPSSVNFEYVNKIIIPELHYNNSGMSQFYMRFIRYTSTEFKDIYFLTYAGSLESNLMQMVVAKEKINLFMKGKDADLDEIYEKFGIDYNLMALLMRRELDEEGHFQIRWGKQLIA